LKQGATRIYDIYIYYIYIYVYVYVYIYRRVRYTYNIYIYIRPHPLTRTGFRSLLTSSSPQSPILAAASNPHSRTHTAALARVHRDTRTWTEYTHSSYEWEWEWDIYVPLGPSPPCICMCAHGAYRCVSWPVGRLDPPWDLSPYPTTRLLQVLALRFTFLLCLRRGNIEYSLYLPI